MGRRFINERANSLPKNCRYLMWDSVGVGRYWKRQLSKSRRRAWKQYGIEGRVDTKYEWECAMKNW